MVHDNDQGGFSIGDPVQLTWNPSRLGRVIAFTAPVTPTVDTAVCMPYVVFPGNRISQPFDASSLRVCKCVTRIPKGVSKC